MRHSVSVLIAVQLIDAIGLGLLLPVLPFFVQEYGATAVQVTQLVALYALASMIFSSPVGWLSDKIGRKPVVVVCTLGSCAAYLAYMSAESLWWVFVVRFFSGVMAAKGGVVSAWMIDLVNEEERARYLGLLGSMNGIGMLLGPILASAFYAASGNIYGSVFLGGAVLSMLACAGLLMTSDSSARSSGQDVQGQTPMNIDLLLLNFAVFLAFSVVFSTSAIYMQARFEWRVTEAGLAIGLMTAVVAIARAFVAHRLLRLLGVEFGTFVTGVLMALCLAVSTIADSPGWFLPFYCLGAGAYSVAAIGVTVKLAERLPPEARGAGMGQLGAAASAAIVFGAGTHGYLFDWVSPQAPFQIYGVLVALFVTGWYVNTLKRRQTIEQT